MLRETVRSNRTWAIAAALAVLLLIWAPWMTAAQAQIRATKAFNSAWAGVADGCGFNCLGCGPTRVQRVPFGCRVVLEFACGVASNEQQPAHQTTSVIVSLLGTVHGLPHP